MPQRTNPPTRFYVVRSAPLCFASSDYLTAFTQIQRCGGGSWNQYRTQQVATLLPSGEVLVASCTPV